MGRRLSERSESELAELTLFLEITNEVTFAELKAQGVDTLALFKHSMAAIEAEAGRSALLKGVRMAVNDTLTALRDANPEEVADLDARLTAAGAPTLSGLWRRQFTERVPALLKRGRIRREEDYYLLVEVLNDLSSSLTDQQRRAASEIVDAYEQRAVADQ